LLILVFVFIRSSKLYHSILHIAPYLGGRTVGGGLPGLSPSGFFFFSFCSLEMFSHEAGNKLSKLPTRCPNAGRPNKEVQTNRLDTDASHTKKV
jgi:hypothetical protein